MTEETISLDRYFAAVWRAKWLIFLAVAGAAAITAFLGFRQPTLYTASALLEVGRVWKEPLEDTYTTTEIINSAGFTHRLAEKAGLRPGQLRRSVRAETVTAGPRRTRYPILVRITATTGSFDESERLASAVADAIIEDHAQLFDLALAPRLERQMRLEEMLKGQSSEAAMRLQAELADVKANNTSPTVTEKTRLVEPVVPGATIAPSPWRNVATSALLALFATVAAAILLELLRPAGAMKSRAVKLE
jgi:capsular polysaccharide biosynthesis protein